MDSPREDGPCEVTITAPELGWLQVFTRQLVEDAIALGHTRLAYIGPHGPAESIADRWQGFSAALADAATIALHIKAVNRPADKILDAIIESGATVAFFIELADAVRVAERIRESITANPVKAERAVIALTASLGVTTMKPFSPPTRQR